MLMTQYLLGSFTYESAHLATDAAIGDLCAIGPTQRRAFPLAFRHLSLPFRRLSAAFPMPLRRLSAAVPLPFHCLFAAFP